MKKLVNEIIELIEISRTMTQEQYEHWKMEALQYCPEKKLVRAFLEEIFKVIDKYK